MSRNYEAGTRNWDSNGNSEAWRTWNLGTEILETWKLELDVQVGNTAGVFRGDICNDQARSRHNPERIAEITSGEAILVKSHNNFLPVSITLCLCSQLLLEPSATF